MEEIGFGAIYKSWVIPILTWVNSKKHRILELEGILKLMFGTFLIYNKETKTPMGSVIFLRSLNCFDVKTWLELNIFDLQLYVATVWV